MCLFHLVLYLGTKMVPLTGSMNADDVAECYEQALFSIWPKSRYTVGVDAMFYLIASYLPTILSDIVYRMPGMRAVPQNVQHPTPSTSTRPTTTPRRADNSHRSHTADHSPHNRGTTAAVTPPTRMNSNGISPPRSANTSENSS